MALTGASEHATGAGRCTAWASGFGGGGLGPARSQPRQCGSVGAAHGLRGWAEVEASAGPNFL